jgi:hypothetical protein
MTIVVASILRDQFSETESPRGHVLRQIHRHQARVRTNTSVCHWQSNLSTRYLKDLVVHIHIADVTASVECPPLIIDTRKG